MKMNLNIATTLNKILLHHLSILENTSAAYVAVTTLYIIKNIIEIMLDY